MSQLRKRDVNDHMERLFPRAGNNRFTREEIRNLLDEEHFLEAWAAKDNIFSSRVEDVSHATRAARERANSLELLQKENVKQFCNYYQSTKIMIVLAPTGSGKTTMLCIVALFLSGRFLEPYSPQRKTMVLALPRILDCVNAARQVSGLMGVVVGGQEVGVRHRGADPKLSRPGQLIQFITYGILEAEALSTERPTPLQQYHHITVDEIHEGSVSMEVTLPKLRQYHIESSTEGQGLRITVMSATINPSEYITFFQQGTHRGPSVFHVVGSNPFNVAEHYLSTSTLSDRASSAANTALILHSSKPRRPIGNSILVFFPGRADIQSAKAILEQTQAIPGYLSWGFKVEEATGGSGASHDTDRFDSTPQERTIILATNAAETSITVRDAGYVVDSGVYNRMIYDWRTRSSQLMTIPISKSQATQRRGRVGRTNDGEYFALYTKAEAQLLRNTQLPAIGSQNITSTVLRLIAAGHHPINYPWLHPPSSDQCEAAITELWYHQAIDPNCRITPTGEILNSTGLDLLPASLVRLAYMYGSTETRKIALYISAMLEEVENIFDSKPASNIRNLLPQIPPEMHGDHAKLGLLLDEFTKQPRNQREQWARTHGFRFNSLQRALTHVGKIQTVMDKRRIPVHGSPLSLHLLLTFAYARNTAVKDEMHSSSIYTTDDDVRASLHDQAQYVHDYQKPMFLIYHKCFKSAEGSRYRLHVVTEINASDLLRSSDYSNWSQFNSQGPVTTRVLGGNVVN